MLKRERQPELIAVLARLLPFAAEQAAQDAE